MAKLSNEIHFKAVACRIYLIFFPIATYSRLGDMVVLRVLGVPVYRRIGDVTNICGYVRKRMSHAS